jgi:hypothetical protein
VRLLADERLHKVGESEARALVGWADGARKAVLCRSLASTADIIRFQAEGRRCVALIDGEEGLEVCLHDLRHLEKLFDPRHYRHQVAFFRWIARAQETKEWRDFDRSLDGEWVAARDAVLADMNGSPIFLFAVLKMKLKMAVRRRLARDLGLAPKEKGALDEEELAAFDRAFEWFLDVLMLSGEVREAARRISAKGNSGGAADVMLRWLS